MEVILVTNYVTMIVRMQRVFTAVEMAVESINCRVTKLAS